VNQVAAASESIQSSWLRTNVRRVRALVFLLLCAGGFWFLIPNSAPPPQVTILPPATPSPRRCCRCRIDGFQERGGWLWKIRYALLGKPIIVDIDTQIIRFREARPPPIHKVFHGRPPLVSTNGMQAWILPEQELNSLCGRLELEDDDEYRNSRTIFGPQFDIGAVGMPFYERHLFRMTLGQGVLATISGASAPQIKGPSFTAGNTISYVVHRQGDFLELAGTFTSSEIVTNAQFRSPVTLRSSASKPISLWLQRCGFRAGTQCSSATQTEPTRAADVSD